MTITPISIAMATYNGAAFLRPQLDSLAGQTHPPAEIVITDDGSTDDTPAIVEDFAATAPFPVRFLQNPARLGFRGNFLRAAGMCNGALVACCDQDDIWHPNKLAAVSAMFDTDPEILLVHHDAHIFNAEGQRTGFIVPPGRYASSFAPMTAPPWLISHGFTQTFRRELLAFQDLWPGSLDATVPNERMTHDQWYLFFASVFGRIVRIESPLADYRQHGGNTYGWTNESPVRRLRQWLEDRSGLYARCRDAAARRAEILDTIRPRLDNPLWRSRAEIGSNRYRTLAALYDSRVQVYQAPGFSRRFSAFRTLYAANAYNYRGDWTFHASKGACKDLALGVIAGPILRRYGYPSAWGDSTCDAVAHG